MTLPAEIEAALGELPQVKEAAVLERRDRAGETRLVAYVVSEGSFDPQRLHAQLEARQAGHALPDSYVPVTSLPLTPAGGVDEQALAALCVIDSNVVRECEERLQSVPGVGQAAVVVEEDVELIPPLHLSDLLPGWKSPSMREANEPRTTLAQAESTRPESSGVPAISHGGELRQDADAPATLPQALRRAARISPERGVVYLEPDGKELFQSYPVLLEEAERVLAGLRKLGLKPQDKVVFQLERNRDFISAFWACQLGGFVPVPISIAPTYASDNSTVGKLRNAWQMLDRPLILTQNTLAPAIRSLSDRLDPGSFRVAVIEDFRRCEPDGRWHECRPDDLAILLLTSGSTGLPKAVMQSHRSLLSQAEGTRRIADFSSQDVSLNWMPLDHVGGIVMFNVRDVYLGCQQIHVPTELILRDPLKWLDFIERFRATITWAPNFAYGLVNSNEEALRARRWDLSSMRFILNAGEAIVARTARRFLKLLEPHGLPGTSMRPAWGMSETSSAVTYSNRFLLDTTGDDDPFVEVGEPIPGFSVRIVNAQDRAVSEGATGRLQVKGSSVLSGYFRNPEVNKEAFTADGWFKTGDLGILRGGRLTITGREKNVIIINGINFHSHEIEATVEEIPGVAASFTAACAVRRGGGDTDSLAVFFSSPSCDDAMLSRLLREIRETVARKFGITPEYLVPVRTGDVPKTAIGKIQHAQLRERFAAGEFDPVLKRVDVLAGNANTLPAWFYTRVWQRKRTGASGISREAEPTLVFLDGAGLGISLRNGLSRLEWPSVGVETGPDFARLGSDRYRIDPKDPEHYRRLLASIAADGRGIRQIAHLWTCDASATGVATPQELEQAQDRGVFSLLYLVQALARRQGGAQPVRLNVISTLAQHVLPGDEVAFQHGPVLGLIRTVPKELPWLDCRHLDLAADDAGANAACIVEEMRVARHDSEVAYRRGERWIPRLERVDFSKREKRDLPFRHGAMYLLSGGLGGIGTEIARYLLKEHEARLLLVGRTPLAPAGAAAGNGSSRAPSERISAYRELQDLPGEVAYESVDICDFAALRRAVEAAQQRWDCELDGVIHLAGTYHERPLVEEMRDSFASVLRPKVQGTFALAQLLEGSEKLFVSFSSANSSLGGALVGAYSAANSFLDGFARHQRRRRSARSYCIEWSMWDELGMSRGFQLKELTRGRGYYIIPASQGLTSLLSVLRSDQAHAVVGLDGKNEQIRKHADDGSRRLQRLCAYFTPDPAGKPWDRLREIALEDRFGTRIECEFQQISELPLTDAGAIDRDRLARLNQRRDQRLAEPVAPRTEVERRIAGFWREVLATAEFGVYESFYELGGNSLLATQVASRIQDVFRVALPLRTVLEGSTIAKLAECVQRQLEQVPARGTGAFDRIETNDAESLLARLDQLSDDEVSALLRKTLAHGETR
jgi:acyl-CoA synthetase (AMP-forming)/AMP-acid ligase II/NAD(P)-dependent dehydrogenase (short-subunit alcohol dehydrogenase family)